MRLYQINQSQCSSQQIFFIPICKIIYVRVPYPFFIHGGLPFGCKGDNFPAGKDLRKGQWSESLHWWVDPRILGGTGGNRTGSWLVVLEVPTEWVLYNGFPILGQAGVPHPQAGCRTVSEGELGHQIYWTWARPRPRRKRGCTKSSKR